MSGVVSLQRWRSSPQRTGRMLREFGTYIGAVPLGVAAGLVSASSRPAVVGIFVGLFLAAALMLSRRALLYFILLGGLVATGIIQLYFPALNYAKYVVPIAGLILLLHAVAERLSRPTVDAVPHTDGIVPWVYVFLAVAGLAMVIAWDPGLAVLGARDYFVMWVTFFALIMTRWPKGHLDFLPKAFLIIAFLQIPFAAHQLLYLVPLREGLGAQIVAVDVIVGTFGASLFGGGANAVLALFMFGVVACLLGLWKSGVLSRTTTAGLSLLFLSPMLFNEVKVAAVYFPVLLLVMFYRDLLERPLRFIAIGLAGFGIFSVLMTALTVFHPSGELRNWSDLFNLVVKQQTSDPSERGEHWSELTRVTAVTFWVSEQEDMHPLHTLIGHGPGASRVQDPGGIRLAETLAETRYGGKRIGFTAISALLWDTGVLGLMALLGMFAAAYRAAAGLVEAYRTVDPFRAGVFDGLRATIVIIVISLAHKDFLVYNLPFQTLVLFILGYLVISWRQLHDRQAGVPDERESHVGN